MCCQASTFVKFGAVNSKRLQLLHKSLANFGHVWIRWGACYTSKGRDAAYGVVQLH